MWRSYSYVYVCIRIQVMQQSYSDLGSYSLLQPHASSLSVLISTQIPVVLLPPLLSKKALPFESFLLPHFPAVKLSLEEASSLPFSKICSMTMSSTCVPKTLSNSCFEGRRRRPCGPWFDERISNAVVHLAWVMAAKGSKDQSTYNRQH